MKPFLVALALFTAAPALAQTTTATPVEFPQKLVEIYKIVPGQQEAFLRFVAKLDAVNQSVGLPPRELYVHSDGAAWDFILIQPAKTPPEKAAAYDEAWAKSGLPSGADFFFEVRRFIVDHSDTFAKGPITAADFLASKTAK